MNAGETRAGRARALGLWLLFVVGGLLVVAQTRFTADLSAFLPKTPTREQQLLVDQLKDGVVSRLVLVGIENAEAPTLAALSRGLARRLRADGHFANVGNGEPVNSGRDREIALAYRYHLSPAVDARRFSEDGLREAIADTIELLGSPAGTLIKPVFTRDPTGELAELLGALDAGERPATRHGVWMAKSGERALLLAQTRALGSDTDAQARALEAINGAFAEARGEAGATAAGASLRLAGSAIFAVNARATIEREATRLSLASTAIIVSLLLFAYRSPTALALGLLPVATGALAGVAAVGLGFGVVHGITIAFGATLIGESVDYAIYLFVQRRQGDGGEWLKEFWPTIRLGVLTSLFGFVSLLFSGFPGLAQLGLYSIAGLIAAALVTRHVLPTILPAGFCIRDLSPLGERLAALLAAARRRRLAWLVPALAVAAAGLLLARHDRLWNPRLSALSPVSAIDQANDELLRGDLAAPDMRYLIVITAAGADAVLASAERLAPRLQELIDNATSNAGLARFDSPHRVLPSLATQTARLAALPARDELERRLAAALAELPLSAGKLGAFLDDVDAARQRPPLAAADLAGSSFGLAVESMLIEREGQWAALLPLRARPGREIDAARVRAAIAASGLDNAWLVDIADESGRLYAGYLREATLLSAGGAVAIVALLLVALRSPARVARVVLPLVATLLVVNGGLTLIGEKLTLLHLVGMLLVVAVGSNYALFFSRPAGESIAPRTLASLALANLTTVAGFGLLAASNVPILRAIGLTVGPGALLALIFAALLAPSDGRPAPAR